MGGESPENTTEQIFRAATGLYQGERVQSPATLSLPAKKHPKDFQAEEFTGGRPDWGWEDYCWVRLPLAGVNEQAHRRVLSPSKPAPRPKAHADKAVFWKFCARRDALR